MTKRIIRSAHGAKLSAKSWLTEAPHADADEQPDPDVAENPHELVVYGGIGRRRVPGNDFDRIVAALKGWKPTRRCSCNPASRSAFSDPCRCAARADRQFQPGAALGDLGRISTSSTRKA
jgi:hypothetical protein